MSSNLIFPTICIRTYADVAELADALALGASALYRGGSSPFIRTSLRRTVVRAYRAMARQVSKRKTRII